MWYADCVAYLEHIGGNLRDRYFSIIVSLVEALSVLASTKYASDGFRLASMFTASPVFAFANASRNLPISKNSVRKVTLSKYVSEDRPPDILAEVASMISTANDEKYATVVPRLINRFMLPKR